MVKPTTQFSKSSKTTNLFRYSAGDETLYDAEIDYETALAYNGGATGTDIVNKSTVAFSSVTKKTTVFTAPTKPTVDYSLASKSNTATATVTKDTTAYTGSTKPTSIFVINPNYSSSLYVDSDISYNDTEVTYLGNDGTQQQYSVKNTSSYTSDQKPSSDFTSTTKPTTEYSQ